MIRMTILALKLFVRCLELEAIVATLYLRVEGFVLPLFFTNK